MFAPIVVDTDTRRVNRPPKTNVTGRANTPFDVNGPLPRRLLVHLPHMQLYIVVPVQPRVVVGRSVEGADADVDLDLEPFNAGTLGVSRRHLALVAENGYLVAVDQDSTNGTLLNREWMPPGQPCVVRSGDQFELGMLQFSVEFLHDE